ncbi:terminase small subunit, partial [Escherichia coli]
NHTDCPLTDFGGKTSIFSHPVYLFLRKFSLQDSRGGSDSAEVVETAFCTFVLSRIAGEIASILDGIPLSVQRRFPELENRHVDFLKRDIIKAMNKAAALDELIPGLLSEYIEQSG